MTRGSLKRAYLAQAENRAGYLLTDICIWMERAVPLNDSPNLPEIIFSRTRVSCPLPPLTPRYYRASLLFFLLFAFHVSPLLIPRNRTSEPTNGIPSGVPRSWHSTFVKGNTLYVDWDQRSRAYYELNRVIRLFGTASCSYWSWLRFILKFDRGFPMEQFNLLYYARRYWTLMQ